MRFYAISARNLNLTDRGRGFRTIERGPWSGSINYQKQRAQKRPHDGGLVSGLRFAVAASLPQEQSIDPQRLAFRG